MPLEESVPSQTELEYNQFGGGGDGREENFGVAEENKMGKGGKKGTRAASSSNVQKGRVSRRERTPGEQSAKKRKQK